MTRFDCDQLLSKLDDLVDETIGDTDAQAVSTHLQACSSCRDEVDLAVRLRKATVSLPKSVEPERDLWPEIASEIDQQRVVHRSFEQPATPAPYAWLKIAAAAAVLIASVTIAYMVGLGRAQPQIAESRPAESGYTLTAYGDFPSELSEARNLLRSGLEQRQKDLSPETWSVVMDNLSVIDQAIVRIETAMEANPGDRRLNRQLATAYRRQIDLLKQATRLPTEA